ncbi:hypothetical protein BDV19DRAFT_363644 [Aspergillus venezuelensis]
MASTTSHSTGDVPRRLPNITPAIGPHRDWWKTGIPVCEKTLIARTAQGDDSLLNPCRNIINAVTTRIETELQEHGVEGPELDRVVFRFLDYAFKTEKGSLERAWREYKEREFEERQ